MHGCVAGEKRTIKNRDVTREQNAVGKDDAVVDVRIMADMNIRHDEVVRADDGFSVGLGGAMNGDVFAKDIVVADAGARGRAVVLQILRRITDDAARVELILGSDSQQAREINMRPDDAASAEFHASVNDRIRPDLHGRIELCFRRNDCGRMNHAGAGYRAWREIHAESDGKYRGESCFSKIKTLLQIRK